MTSEWQKLEDISGLLQPFAEHTDINQKDIMSVSSVIPVLMDLKYHLYSSRSVHGLGAMAQTLLIDLNNRFNVLLDPTVCDFDLLPAAATLLDPSLAVTMFTQETGHLLSAARTFIIE